MPTFTHTASSGQFVAFISDADGNVFNHRATAFVAPAALVGREKEAATPMSGPDAGVYTGEVSNLPPGVYTANIFEASTGHLSQAAIDGTLTPTATKAVVQYPPTRESFSTSVVSVESAGTPAFNGAALLAAYAQAKTLAPNGAALSAANRATVVIEPGVYDLDGQTLSLDTQFVDIIGSDPFHTIIQTLDATTVAQTANDAAIERVLIRCSTDTVASGDRDDPAAYVPDRNLANARLKDVRLQGVSAAHATVYDLNNNDSFVGSYENVEIVSGAGLLIFGGTARRVRSSAAWGPSLTASARLYFCEGATGSFASKTAGAKTLFCTVNNAAYASND